MSHVYWKHFPEIWCPSFLSNYDNYVHYALPDFHLALFCPPQKATAVLVFTPGVFTWERHCLMFLNGVYRVPEKNASFVGLPWFYIISGNCLNCNGGRKRSPHIWLDKCCIVGSWAGVKWATVKPQLDRWNMNYVFFCKSLSLPALHLRRTTSLFCESGHTAKATSCLQMAWYIPLSLLYIRWLDTSPSLYISIISHPILH